MNLYEPLTFKTTIKYFSIIFIIVINIGKQSINLNISQLCEEHDELYNRHKVLSA